MEFSATGGILGDQLIKALGNTLMHSLWQGVLLAIAGGLIISLTRKQTAALRYNLLLAAMLLFTCGVAITFLMQLQPARGAQITYVNGANPVVNAAAGGQPQLIVAPNGTRPVLTNVVLSYFNRYCNTIVMIWFLIICIKSVKLAAGVYEVYQLRRIKISAVSKYWEDRVAQLSAQLKVKQVIGLAESGIAKVPMVIGHLKPLILIPVGFINALPPAEVEAILAHELAHIRRRDYLVNLLQSFMEIVFFFNPAVLWISQLLKAERENCCDDIALEHTNSKYGYIQALLSCQEYKPAPGLGMAMSGQKGNLLDRVKRIVNNNNQSLNIMEKTLLTIGLVAAGICTVAFSANKEIKINPNHQATAQGQTRHITVDPKVGYVFKTGTKTYSFNKTDAKISELKVNGKKIPDAQAAKYRPQIDALLKQNEQAQKAETASDTTRGKTKLYKQADFDDGTTMKVMASKDGKKQTAYVFKRDGVLYQFFMKGTHATAVYVNGEEKPVSQYQSKIDDLIEEYDEVAAVAPVAPAAPVMALGPLQSPAPMAMVAPVTPMAPPTPLKPMSAAFAMAKPIPPMAPMKPMIAMTPLPPVKMDTMFRVITQSLIKQGVIKDKNDYDIDITNKYLSVDGVKQSEELHKQVLDKLRMKPGDKINWHYSNHE
ncbi:MAG: M56 family metallopeptidase [Bacteroidota bacterium]